MKSIKHILLLMVVVLLSSCATTSPDQYVILESPSPNYSADFAKEETYNEFAANIQNPFSKNANKLWMRLCDQDPEAAIAVSYGSKAGATNNIPTHEWRHHFKDPSLETKAGYRLNILYTAIPDYAIPVHAQITATSDYKQRRELAMVKKEYMDSIATFKTKEFGTDIQVVTRAISSTKNILAWITMHSTDTSEAAKQTMIARIQSLNEDDIFPIDLVRYKAEENLRDIQLQFASINVSKETFASECVACATLLKTNDKVSHVIVKSNKDADNVRYILDRPLVGKSVETDAHSIQSMKEYEVCVGSHTVLPGEQMKLVVQDSKGIELDKYSFVPNPIILSSVMDEGKIEFEIMNPECYLIRGRLEGKVEFESMSYNETLEQSIDDFNDSVIVFQAGVVGKSGGIAHLKFKRESGEELKISLPWGTALNI